MFRKIFFAVPFMTILWLAPSAILAAEPADVVAAVISEESAEPADGTAPAGDMAEQTEKMEKPAEEAALPAMEAANPSMDTAEQKEPDAAEGGGADGAGQGDKAAEALLQQPSYTEEDLYVMAHVLAGECQNCPDEEQLYVGSVVLNRKAHPSFPGTVKSVVFQKGQYSCTRDGNYDREPTERNWANARRLLEEGSVLPGNVVWQSGKKQGRGVYVRTRWHYYCY